MRKLVLWGFVLVLVSILCFLNVTPIERRTLNPDDIIALTASATKPLPVQVTNFPPTQSVGGTVAVSNLPLDAQGNVRIAGNLGGSTRAPHLIGVTQASLPVSTTLLDLSRACNTDFPGTRLCDVNELTRSIPPPEVWTARYVWVMIAGGGTGVNGIDFRACFDSASTGNPVADCNAPPPFPAMCCGY